MPVSGTVKANKLLLQGHGAEGNDFAMKVQDDTLVVSMSNITLMTIAPDHAADLNTEVNTSTLITLDKNVRINGNLTVSSNIAVAGNETVSGILSVSSNLIIAGNETLSGNLSVAGNETLSGNLTVSSNIAVAGNETLSGNLTVSGKFLGNATDAFMNFNEYKDTKIFALVRKMADAMGFRRLTSSSIPIQDQVRKPGPGVNELTAVPKFVKIDPSASRYSLYSEKLDLLTYFTASYLMSGELINDIVQTPEYITIDPRQAELSMYITTANSVTTGDGTTYAPIEERSMYKSAFKFQYIDTLNNVLQPQMMDLGSPTGFMPRSTYQLFNFEVDYDKGLQPVPVLGPWVYPKKITNTHQFIAEPREYRGYAFPQGRYFKVEDGNTIYAYGPFYDYQKLLLRFGPLFYPALVAGYKRPNINGDSVTDSNGQPTWFRGAKHYEYNGNKDLLAGFRADPSKASRPWEYYHDDITNNLKTNGVFDAYKIEAWVAKEMGKDYDESGNLIVKLDANGNAYESIDHTGCIVIRTVDEYYNTIGSEAVGKQFSSSNIIVNKNTTPLPVTNWSTGPFKGYLVVCLVKVIASVVPAYLLAQLGATVIFIRDPEEVRADYFDVALQNVGVVVELNLRASSATGTADRATFEDLLSRAHVFITNLKQSNYAKMGYTYEQLAGFSGNRGIVIGEFSAYGPGTFYSSKGFADNVSQANGLADVMQRYSTPSSKYPFSFYQDNIAASTYFNALLDSIRKKKIYGGSWLVKSSLGQSGAFVAKNTMQNTPLESIKLYDSSGNPTDVDMSSFGKFKTETIPNCGFDLLQFNSSNVKVFRDWTVKSLCTPFNIANSNCVTITSNIAFGNYTAVTTPPIHTSAITTLAQLDASNLHVPYAGGPTISMKTVQTLAGTIISLPLDGYTYKHNIVTPAQAVLVSSNISSNITTLLL